MAAVALSPAGTQLTPKAFAAWAMAMTLMLAICLSIALVRVGPGAFTIAFVPTVVLVLVLSWTGRFDRLLPAALATLLVAFWPLYQWLVHGDAETARVYLFLAGFLNVLLLMLTAMEAAKRRGWVVESRVRSYLLTGLFFANAMVTVTGRPAGAWHRGVIVAWFAVFLSGFFWPARPRPSQPGQSVTA